MSSNLPTGLSRRDLDYIYGSCRNEEVKQNFRKLRIEQAIVAALDNLEFEVKRVEDSQSPYFVLFYGVIIKKLRELLMGVE